MPFSNRSPLEASKVQNLPTLQERYALRRCMADTALGKLYWAQDLKQTQGNGELANVLVFTLLPTLAQNPVFEQAFGHVLPNYQKLAPGMPHVTDDGKTADGTRWMVMDNIGGMLLSERLAELDDRGMPMPDVMELLDSISNVIASQRPDGIFGYLEPDAVLLSEKPPCLLTAPVAAALRVAYNSSPAERSRQTLHSGYISPEVLLGDTPTAEDDTFSIACLAYHLLQGALPFGKQSTLEAAVRNLSPSSIRKLRPDAWLALQQGLSLKRASRQKTPATLLHTLQRKQHKKLLLPIAAFVAASAVAISTYHLLSSWGSNPPEQAETQLSGISPVQPPNAETTTTADGTSTLVGENGVAPALDQESVQREADKLAAETAAARVEAERLTAATTDAAELAADTDIATLQDKAADAIRKGKLFSNDPETPSAVDYLRKAVALEPDNTKTQKLLAQMINDQHSEAETLLTAGKLDEASTLLSTADRLITEFTLGDSLKRQVSLESEVEQAKRKQALEPDATATTTTTATTSPDLTSTSTETGDATQYLERAQRAIGYGNLSAGDDRSESAVAYLSTLLEQTPDHPEAMKLLEKVVTLQQDSALTMLRKRDTEKARSSLNDSQALIGKYKLDDLVEEQIALEKRYRETLAMGVFTPGKDDPVTASKPEQPSSPPAASITATPEPAATPAASITAPPEPTATPAASIIATPQAAPAAAPPETENPEAASAPVEVSVPPDIPVQGAMEIPAGTAVTPMNPAELPPIQLDTPPAPAAPPGTVTFEVPAADAANGSNTFTLDVPNLMEVPLDSIKDSLPPADNN